MVFSGIFTFSIRSICVKINKRFPSLYPGTSMEPSSFSNLAVTSCVEYFWSFSVAVFVKDTRFYHLKEHGATFYKPEISKIKKKYS